MTLITNSNSQLTWKQCKENHEVIDSSDGLKTCTAWCKEAHHVKNHLTCGECVYRRHFGYYCNCINYVCLSCSCQFN